MTAAPARGAPRARVRATTGPHRITARTIQIGLGGVWLVDGLLQLQPSMFTHRFVTGTLLPAAQGQPSFLAWPILHVAHLVSLDPAAWNALFAAVQVLIGIGLLRRDTVRPALLLSFAWAGGVWVFGEGLGMLLTGTASPVTGAPGAALLYAVVGVLVWPRRPAPAERGCTTRAAHRVPGSSAAADGPLGERGARAVWAVLWLGMAALWLSPANRAPGSLSGALGAAPAGAPSAVAHLQTTVAQAFSGLGLQAAVVLVLASGVIGLGPLLAGRYTAFFLVAGAALSLDYWLLGQSLGGLLSGQSTDPNAGPLVILLAMALFPNRPA